MSTEADAPAAAEEKIVATLIRGRSYYLREKEFLFEVPVEVTAAEKAWLEEQAIDIVSIEGEGDYQERPKFKFSTGSAPVVADPLATPPRRRSRA